MGNKKTDIGAFKDSMRYETYRVKIYEYNLNQTDDCVNQATSAVSNI